MTEQRPPAGALRQAVEQRSAVALVWLAQRPRWILPVSMAAILGGVVFLPTVPALVCLVVLLSVVGWLSYLSWPAADGRGRLLRIGTLTLMVVLGVQSVSS